MTSVRELTILKQLNDLSKEALQNVKPLDRPIENPVNKLITRVQTRNEIIGYDPEVLLLRIPPQVPNNQDENFLEVGINRGQRSRRLIRYTKRILNSGLPFQKYPNETNEDFYNRLQQIYNNLPQQASIDEQRQRGDIIKLKTHLSEIMNTEDIERVINSDIIRNHPENILIVNNTWNSFLSQLKKRFETVDVDGFVNFLESYIDAYNKNKGIETPINVINVQIPEEEKDEIVYVEDGNQFIFKQIEKRGGVEFSVKLTDNTGVEHQSKYLSTRNTVNSVNYRNLFATTPQIMAFYGNGNKAHVIQKTLELFNTGHPANIGDPLTPADLPAPVGGIGLSKSKRKSLHHKILLGEIKAGNNNIRLRKKSHHK